MSTLIISSDDIFFLNGIKHALKELGTELVKLNHILQCRPSIFLSDNANENNVLIVSVEHYAILRQLTESLFNHSGTIIVCVNTPMDKLYVKNRNIYITSKKNKSSDFLTLLKIVRRNTKTGSTCLTERESQICQLDARGKSIFEISNRNNISSKTAYALRYKAFLKTRFRRKGAYIYRKYISLFC
ncbi:helix-turn-helix transcriptional regulator [Enterobacter sp. BNK-8]|uniref:helix-turn-helix transcriptional regulator n=1 Tax=Enterobacter sp. BNK-8 TaxID=3376145 RepID=UPI003B50CA5C